MKILLVQFRPAGDVLLLTPVFGAIKKKFPDATLVLAANRKESALVEHHPHLDRIIRIEKVDKTGIRGYRRYLGASIDLLRQVRREKFDVVVDFIGNPKSAMCALASGAPLRIGRRLGPRSIAYNAIIPPADKNLNTILLRLNHLRPLGIDPVYAPPSISLSAGDMQFGADYIKSLSLAEHRPLIVLAPNSPRASRRWRPDFFAETGKTLARHHQAKILLAWGPGEEEYTGQIRQAIGGDAELIPLTSLAQMAAIFSHARLMISNCSGSRHIAYALGVPAITIYGPTNPSVWNHADFDSNPALYGSLDCIPCERRECPFPDQPCMGTVTPAMVCAEANRLLAKKV